MKKRWMSGTLALLLAGTTVASMMPAVSVKAEGNTATGTTYYVDSQGGDNSNDGTAEGKAFQTLDKVNALDLAPGDTVLLKKGSVFEDQALKFTKEDSGTARSTGKNIYLWRGKQTTDQYKRSWSVGVELWYSAG